jgi:hypothetical protein
MGMAKINVWVSDLDDLCSVSSRTWYVTIYDCDGNVLQWCNKRYAVLPARCGHLEVEVPPGCYYIKAVWGFHLVKPAVYWANHFTDAAIVQARCDESVCVKLFTPSAHRCGYIYVRVIEDLLKNKAIEPAAAKEAEAAINAVLRHAPQPEKKFEMGHEEEIRELIRKEEQTEKRTKR